MKSLKNLKVGDRIIISGNNNTEDRKGTILGFDGFYAEVIFDGGWFFKIEQKELYPVKESEQKKSIYDVEFLPQDLTCVHRLKVVKCGSSGVGIWESIRYRTNGKNVVRNLAGLKGWMREDQHGEFDPKKLEYFKNGIWKYGDSDRFYVPEFDQSGKCVEHNLTVVCKDSFGVELQLTVGKEYNVKTKGDLYEVDSDDGMKRGFFRDRFEVLKK